MDLPSALRERLPVHEGAALGPWTTLGVGGPAPFVIEPRSTEDLVWAVGQIRAAGLAFRMLGHGSNLLISDEGVSEIVIATRALRGIWRASGRESTLRCEAGATLARLVSVAHELGLTGAEALIGIPGTIGGAVAGNAGGAHGSIGDRLAAVEVVDGEGQVRTRACVPGDFGYRRSPFAAAVVLAALVALEPAPRAAVRAKMEAVLREKTARQPLAARSSGCMFKNPVVGSSGRLIDESGCKGLNVGGARVSERHANFVLNEGRATASDVCRLLAEVKRRVWRQRGVRLELEVQTWGRLPELEERGDPA